MNFIPYLSLKLGIKVNLLGPLFAVGVWGSIVATLWQIRWDPWAAAGRAQLVVEKGPLGPGPYWTHSLLTIWENMLVQ